ncbi:hypothetical protein Ancab_018926 [Ancistrocladus abbreviatus]
MRVNVNWINSHPIILKGYYGLKKNGVQLFAIGFVLVAGFWIFAPIRSLAKLAVGSSEDCQFPAIYNFGDSNSDTGSVSAAFGRVPYPNGMTFFGKPSGRYSDGRLIIDFIAEELGLPYLSAYLDSIEANFSHGADFAASGTTIQAVDGKMYGSGFNPLSLKVQLSQFEQLKARTHELCNQAKSFVTESRLPRFEDFSKALYTFDIGQNDIHYGLTTMSEDQVQQMIPISTNQLALAIESLYKQGARTFWIHNTGPIGCLPYFLINSPAKPENSDQIGCIKSYNKVAKEFNKQLKDRVLQLQIKLPDAVLAYVDVFSAKYSLISEAKKNVNSGFIDPFGFCCKHPGESHLLCWDSRIVNGTEVFATSCNNPSEYISWDSIHYTDAANRWVANRIFDGSFSDPLLPIKKASRKLGLPHFECIS